MDSQEEREAFFENQQKATESKMSLRQSQYTKFFNDPMGKTKDQFGDNEAYALEKSVYFTDEVKIKIEGDQKFVNEFKIMNNIGHGSFSKVKKVMRQWQDGQEDNQGLEEKLFAMKVS